MKTDTRLREILINWSSGEFRDMDIVGDIKSLFGDLITSSIRSLDTPTGSMAIIDEGELRQKVSRL